MENIAFGKIIREQEGALVIKVNWFNRRLQKVKNVDYVSQKERLRKKTRTFFSLLFSAAFE